MSTTITPVAEFAGVGKRYTPGPGEAWAVRGIDLRVGSGEVLGLLGPNRAGKTTLAKLLLSLSRPTTGQVARFGRPAEDRRTLARVGYVHEDPAFPRDLTATGLLHYYGALTCVPGGALRRRVPALLDRVGLADRRRDPIGIYSKGMVQRLGLAQALLNEPDLLVLDEPTEGLDAAGRLLVGDLIREHRDRGRAAILISHALSDVERLCDRIAVLAEGRAVFDGPLAELVRDPMTGATRPLEQSMGDLIRRTAA